MENTCENDGLFMTAKLFKQPHFGITTDQCGRRADDVDIFQARYLPIDVQSSVTSIQPAKCSREP